VVIHRSRRPRLRFTSADRILWAWLSHAWGGWRSAVHIVKPETVIAWHRRGFRLFWTWKSRHRTGRPALPPDLRALIRDMSTANPLWGAPRIHGELQKLGIATSQSTVAKYMRRHPRPPSQTWRTFLTNHASQIIAADLFVVPTVTFRLLFVLVMLVHDRRRLVHMAVTEHPTAAWTAQQLRNAFSNNDAPRYLLHDRDSVFANVATTIERMNIEEVRAAPRSPWQNAYAERVIGSIRRECVDHVIVINAAGLHRLLTEYVAYYMRSRTHLALGKDTPITRPVAPPVGRTHCHYPRSRRTPPLRPRCRVAVASGDPANTHLYHQSVQRFPVT
jgi:transposase InsO family protein